MVKELRVTLTGASLDEILRDGEKLAQRWAGEFHEPELLSLSSSPFVRSGGGGVISFEAELRYLAVAV